MTKVLFLWMSFIYIPSISFAIDLEPETSTSTMQEMDMGDDFSDFDDEFMDEDTNQMVYKPPFDPLIGFNRAMFHFNDKLYFWVLKPVARGYGWVVPRPVRSGLQRMVKNILFPIRFVNNILQLKGRGAGRELSRFLLNSTVGVAGFFDPAQGIWNIEPSDEDFGQTLGRYGVGEIFPITLPFLGPTNLRDALGKVPDYFLNPVRYVDPNEAKYAIGVAERVNYTSLNLGQYEALKQDALDPYTFLRDAFKQMRDRQIEE